MPRLSLMKHCQALPTKLCVNEQDIKQPCRRLKGCILRAIGVSQKRQCSKGNYPQPIRVDLPSQMENNLHLLLSCRHKAVYVQQEGRGMKGKGRKLSECSRKGWGMFGGRGHMKGG